jgi:hypothetical protein
LDVRHGQAYACQAAPIARRSATPLALIRLHPKELACLTAAAIAFSLAPAGAGAQSLSFTGPFTHGAGEDPVWIAVGNLNGDGDPDLVVANTSGHSVSVFEGSTGASFLPAASFAISGSNPRAAALADVNGDGEQDLLVSSVPNTLSVQLGGTGVSFGSPSAVTIGGDLHEIAVGQFDAGNDPDVAVANANGPAVSVVRGGAMATFGSPAHFPDRKRDV